MGPRDVAILGFSGRRLKVLTYVETVKYRTRHAEQTNVKHGLKRTVFSELRRQSLMPEGTLDQPVSNQSSYLLGKTVAAISFIRDVYFQYSMVMLLLLLLAFFISHFPPILLPLLHHNPITYHLPCPTPVKEFFGEGARSQGHTSFVASVLFLPRSFRRLYSLMLTLISLTARTALVKGTLSEWDSGVEFSNSISSSG